MDLPPDILQIEIPEPTNNKGPGWERRVSFDCAQDGEIAAQVNLMPLGGEDVEVV
jgi:hypothetical protein